MKSDLLFGEILEAVDEMSLDEQETLTDIIRRRIIERRRRQLITEVHDAQKEFQAGNCQSVMPDELMAEILS
jgi:hypothetical protein